MEVGGTRDAGEQGILAVFKKANKIFVLEKKRRGQLRRKEDRNIITHQKVVSSAKPPRPSALLPILHPEIRHSG